jgi:uncharacterized protein YndB with AHSA1/START domain
MTDAANNLVLTRVLDAPRDKLWRCWVEPELLKRWFCPTPWHVSEARIDLRPGGEFFTLMNGLDGERFGEPGVFLEVVENERLVFTDAFRPGWRPSGRAFMAAEVLFADAGAGRTRYTARHALERRGAQGARGDGLPRGLGPGRRSARSPRQDALIARRGSHGAGDLPLL